MIESPGYSPDNGAQQPSAKKSQGYELKTDARFVGQSVEKGSQDLPKATVVSNEGADAQIAKALDDLRAKVSPELYDKVIKAAGKRDGDEFKTQVAIELRNAIGDEAFNQFNADTTVSRPFVPFNRQGGSPTTTRAHGEDETAFKPVFDTGYRTQTRKG